MRSKRFKNYIALVQDAEGVSYQYVSTAESRQHAENEARESLEEWGATLVGMTPVEDRPVGPRRLARLAALTAVVFGVGIAAMMFIGLSIEGAL